MKTINLNNNVLIQDVDLAFPEVIVHKPVSLPIEKHRDVFADGLMKLVVGKAISKFKDLVHIAKLEMHLEGAFNVKVQLLLGLLKGGLNTKKHD